MGFFLTDVAKHFDKGSAKNRVKTLKKIKRPKTKRGGTTLIGFGKFSTPKSMRKKIGGGR